MGTFKEEITLANACDISNARNGVIPDAKIRRITVDAMPDTGAWTLIINEATRQKLGLAIRETVKSSLADGSAAQYGLTEPVEIRWKDRRTSQEAVVLPDAGDILLGALPLEGMDLMVDPVNQRLTGVHGDQRIHLVK
ncbi:MAG: aspartyl protease family protein [Spirochaetaceae bacterium]|jgi:clan AA aspartic protease|nr:aspartyl protease family protein [Spirochaetaceae bacterium]